MTLVTMQQHEAVTLAQGASDFRRKSLNALALRHVRGPDVLDMRCLSGQLCLAMARGGHRVTGLDAYAPAVEMTNDLLRDAGFAPAANLWDLRDLPGDLRERRFDGIVCMDVLNHVPDERIALAQVAELLKPGGRAVFLVPAWPRLLGARDRNLGHLRRFRPGGFRELLAEAGLQVCSLRQWNSLALPVQFIWEQVLKRELRDKVRYAYSEKGPNLRNRLLSAWYLHVENNIPFPLGLSLFVTAEKPEAQNAPAGENSP